MNPYQDILLDHCRNPRHQTDETGPPDCELRNPLCGDLVRLWGDCDGKVQVRFQAEGCAICVAAASIMCESVEGCTAAKASKLTNRVIAAFDANGDAVDDSDALAALCDVRNFPMRSRCATLAWSALEELLSRGA